MTYCLFVIVVALFVIVHADTYQVIATGRGVITGVQIGTKWELREMPYTGSLRQQWSTHNSDLTLNGRFIAMRENGLVWDAQGYKFDAGTPIILYKEKHTIVDTKNQRWSFIEQSINQIHRTTMVVNVTQSGKLALAPWSHTYEEKRYQSFVYMYPEKWVNFTFYNFHSGPVNVSSVSRAGTVLYGVLAPNQIININLFDTSSIHAFDAKGKFMEVTSMFSSRGNSGRVPKLNFPRGEQTWIGNFTADQLYATSFTMTHSPLGRYDHFFESGSNQYGGAFSFKGYLFDRGTVLECWMYLQYSSPVKSDYFSGTMNYAGTYMSGNWSGANVTGTFQFSLPNIKIRA